MTMRLLDSKHGTARGVTVMRSGVDEFEAELVPGMEIFGLDEVPGCGDDRYTGCDSMLYLNADHSEYALVNRSEVTIGTDEEWQAGECV